MSKLLFTLALTGMSFGLSLNASAACPEKAAEKAAKALYSEETGNRDGLVKRIEEIDAGNNRWYAAVASPRSGEAEIRFVFTMRKNCRQVDLSRILGDDEDAQ